MPPPQSPVQAAVDDRITQRNAVQLPAEQDELVQGGQNAVRMTFERIAARQVTVGPSPARQVIRAQGEAAREVRGRGGLDRSPSKPATSVERGDGNGPVTASEQAAVDKITQRDAVQMAAMRTILARGQKQAAVQNPAGQGELAQGEQRDAVQKDAKRDTLYRAARIAGDLGYSPSKLAAFIQKGIGDDKPVTSVASYLPPGTESRNPSSPALSRQTAANAAHIRSAPKSPKRQVR
ncbi:hypothetical protein GCM10009863_39660 [Streptomyces axinellae]|uniref:Uncharacterized protein n=2 Tax=Streptomyces axinellae TaxID=552788 RepID=A0ABP6CQF8_9ACTN